MTAGLIAVVILAPVSLALWLATRALRLRGLDQCLIPYLLSQGDRRSPSLNEPVHLLLCIADHFEPMLGDPPPEVARARVDRWVHDYPRVLGGFRDSDGRPPRHTFFYPVEAYDPADLDALSVLCRAGYGEVEIHLHHDGDTPENLRKTLQEAKERLAGRHGLLSRRRDTGDVVFGFVHGNWALDNARPDGRMCGVNNELDILRESGCYADFTLPSAPSPTQTRQINSIYYAADNPLQPKSHNVGVKVGSGDSPAGALMLIQGPLLLDWGRARWGIVPRIENACIQANQVPSMERIDLWLQARIQVPSRPDWFFVKLHTHGAKEANADVLLGEPMIRFHEGLASRAAEKPNFHYHYVTAREMFNLARAAEAGWDGTVEAARDFEIIASGLDLTEPAYSGEKSPSDMSTCKSRVKSPRPERRKFS